jgi:hypothetical protein
MASLTWQPKQVGQIGCFILLEQAAWKYTSAAVEQPFKSKNRLSFQGTPFET